MSNVIALKLVSGEELVVEITEENDSTITFKNPVATVMQRSDKGPVLGFMPWMQAADGPFTIGKNVIMLTAEVADEVKNGYNQIFGAGIVVPPKGLITG
jgi:hypothetical protein